MRGCGRSTLLRLLALVPAAAGLRTRQQETLGLVNSTSAADNSTEPPRSYRVAVLTSGVLLRYFLEPTARNLVAPLVAEGHTVDVHLSLNTEEFLAWKGYARLFKPDPAIEGRHRNLSFVAEMFNRTLTGAGAAVRTLDLRQVVNISTEPVKNFALYAEGWHRGMGSRAMGARSNALKLLWQFEDLWGRVQATEAVHGRYDFVIVTRDDGLWVAPFSLRRVLQSSSRAPFFPDHMVAPPLATHVLQGPVQGYHMRCLLDLGSFWDATRDGGVTEYAFVLRRESAAPFLTLFSRLVGSTRYWGLQNLEAYLAAVAADEGIHLQALPSALLPMQRAGRVPYRGSTATCLHKMCDSATMQDGATEAVGPLWPTTQFPMCKWEIHQKNLNLPTLDPSGFPPDSS